MTRFAATWLRCYRRTAAATERSIRILIWRVMSIRDIKILATLAGCIIVGGLFAIGSFMPERQPPPEHEFIRLYLPSGWEQHKWYVFDANGLLRFRVFDCGNEGREAAALRILRKMPMTHGPVRRDGPAEYSIAAWPKRFHVRAFTRDERTWAVATYGDDKLILNIWRRLH